MMLMLMRMAKAISNRPRRGRLLAPTCALLFCGACIGELDTASQDHDLRVLALKADPPECYLGRDEARFRLTALVADVEAGALVERPRHYRVSTCPDPEGGRCEGRAGELVLGEGTFSGETFALDFAFGASHAALLEAALRADAYHGFGGLPVTLAVKVWTDAATEYAAKSIVLQLPTLSLEGEPANENPPAPVVLVNGAPIAADGSLAVAARSLELDVDPAARAEKPDYRVPTFTGGALTLHESWTYAWFSTRGAYAPESTGGLNPVSQADLAVATTLQLDDDDEPGPFVSWVVLRDGRGGVSWTRFAGRFEALPEEPTPEQLIH